MFTHLVQYHFWHLSQHIIFVFTFVNIPLHLLQIRVSGASCSFSVLSDCAFFPFFLTSVLPFFLPLLPSGSVMVLFSKFCWFLLEQLNNPGTILLHSFFCFLLLVTKGFLLHFVPLMIHTL